MKVFTFLRDGKMAPFLINSGPSLILSFPETHINWLMGELTIAMKP